MPILRGNRKTAKSEYELRLVCMTVCLSVRMKQLGPQWTNFEEIWHLNISRKSIEKIQDLLPGEAVGWGTALQTRSSRVWFPMLSMEFFIDINLWHWGRLSLIEMSTRDISLGVWGGRLPVRTTDNLTTFMCPLSWNLGASNSWNPRGLSRLVRGLFFLRTGFTNK